MEDSNGYFYPFTPVENYKSTEKGEPAMMLWALIGAIWGAKICTRQSQKRGYRFDTMDGTVTFLPIFV
jgi:hypothetical protein